MEDEPSEEDLLRYEEMAEDHDHVLKVDSFEHWMTYVDEGKLTLEEAIDLHRAEMSKLGLLGIVLSERQENG